MATRTAIWGSALFLGGVLLATYACSGGNGGDSATSDGGGTMDDDGSFDDATTAEGGGVMKDGTAPQAPCGRNSMKCPTGGKCAGAPDCTSGICRNGVCAAPDGMDATATETDVGCGGPNAPACADGKKCKVADDCIDGVCTMGVCAAPTCVDNLQNGNETGKDCGGGVCPLCADGLGCKNGVTDCASGVCTNNLCAASACDDMVKNGTETDVDCGGSCPGKCGTNKGCKANTDCASALCDTVNTHTCKAPSPTDTVQNGGETDIDCGGAILADGSKNMAADNAPACAVGKKCLNHYDCTSDGCDYTGHCALAPSCAPHYGGDTCGAGETGTGAANGENHESCCASIPLPNNTVQIDKYEITAGRMREFLRRVGNDVNTWYQAWKIANPTKVAAVGIRPQDEQYLPTGLASPTVAGFKWNSAIDGNPNDGVTQQTGHDFGVYDHLGNTVFFADRPSDFQGCYLGPGQYQDGHPTYWFSDAEQADRWGAGPRAFTQQQLDEKALNCVTQLLLAAFCAWDGGRLPTAAELAGAPAGNTANSAWGSGPYPWGNTPAYTDTWTTTVPGRVNMVSDNLNGTQTTNPSYWDVLMPINQDNGDHIGHANLMAPVYNTTNWNNFYPFLPTGLRYYWPELPFGNCPPNNGDPNYLTTCPAVLPAGKTCPTNCGWGQNDQSYEVAAPGRFVNDRRSNPNPGAPGGAHDGWFDLTANVMEVTNDGPPGNPSAVDDGNHDNLLIKGWVGGSFEGHGVTTGAGHIFGGSGNGYNSLTKYGKMGGRCAR